ncbi:MAG: hypothetical protein NTV56_17460 [Alphaproteobacteria bacterium]|nr:hypothetical protein [Alphaproteobacteria bacterium]
MRVPGEALPARENMHRHRQPLRRDLLAGAAGGFEGWWRVAIQARCDGCTERQSRRAADAAAENWRKQEALTKRPQVK